MTTEIQKMIEDFNWEIEHAERQMKKWAEEFIKNPARQLELTTTFEEAARLEVHSIIRRYLKEFDALANEDKNADELIMIFDRFARYAVQECHSTSTSVPLNEMRRCMSMQWYRIWSDASGMMSRRRSIIEALTRKYEQD